MACTPNAISAYGALLQVSDQDGNNFVDVAELASLSGPSMNADVIEVTVHNPSCTGPFKQFIAGLIDPGDVSFDINMLPTHATHNATTGLLGMLTTRSRRTFRILWPDPAQTPWSFPGQVTQFAPSANPTEALKASVTVKVLGAPTFG